MAGRTQTRPSGLILTEAGENEIEWEITKPHIGHRKGKLFWNHSSQRWLSEGLSPNSSPGSVVELSAVLEDAVHQMERSIEAQENLRGLPKSQMDEFFGDGSE